MTLLQAGNCTHAAGCEIFLNLKYFQNISAELQQTRTEVKQQRLGLRTREGRGKGVEGEREGEPSLTDSRLFQNKPNICIPTEFPPMRTETIRDKNV